MGGVGVGGGKGEGGREGWCEVEARIKGDKDTRRARPRTCLLQVLFFLGVVTAGLCGAVRRCGVPALWSN